MIENIKLRELPLDSINVDEIIQLYQEYTKLESECEHVQFLRREIAEYLAGKRTLDQLPSQITEQSQRKTNLFNSLQEKAVKLPNFTHPQVMNYCKENSNQPRVIKYVNENLNENLNTLPTTTSPKLSHFEICERLNLFESANECSGPKFFFLKNEGVLLEIALQNFAISKLMKKGFKMIMPPELMKQHIVEGCGFQPRGEHSQIYRIENSNNSSSSSGSSSSNNGSNSSSSNNGSNSSSSSSSNNETNSSDQLCLIGTSEIGLAALHANKVILFFDETTSSATGTITTTTSNMTTTTTTSNMTTTTTTNSATTTTTTNHINSTPYIKYAGLSHCFRTEAGAAGAKDRGLYRVHQFTKVEMFIYCTPEKSEELLEEIIQIQEEIFSELGLSFQILDMPCNDLGNPAHRKIDMEAYIPSRGGFGEVSSASNCTDYQSRKLNIRYKVDFVRFKSFYPHTLNGTAMAVPRAMIAILEKNQFYDEKTGKLGVRIPECLHPFMLNGATVIMEK
ncbi:hypothetical protein C9374_001283 [Naegleria lovaniensis]|uniref:serine--tRNA ligase n=1 Tax=Naegleria lovaniensis TaxID=51637 RepID=A0AA88GX29_NAELO|nr:uncharacterized protein C9374_001283 [Naegleria lovaniensis]KAG2387689.1 hypothetical protein C9374_001283 [Naegleria lovaniensis]